MKLQALGPADDPNRLAIVDFFPYSNLALWCSECHGEAKGKLQLGCDVDLDGSWPLVLFFLRIFSVQIH